MKQSTPQAVKSETDKSDEGSMCEHTCRCESPVDPVVATHAEPDWLGTWRIEKDRPATYFSVLVWGVLEGEVEPDCHEGYWDGRKWSSVRHSYGTVLDKLKISNVTHWIPRPVGPNNN